MPGGQDRGAGQRHVDDVGRELLLELERLELGEPRVDRGLERLTRLVGALADRPALLGRELADVAQQVRQLGFTAEEAHADVLELGGCGGGGDRRLPLGAQCGDPVGGAHGRLILVVEGSLKNGRSADVVQPWWLGPPELASVPLAREQRGWLEAPRMCRSGRTEFFTGLSS